MWLPQLLELTTMHGRMLILLEQTLVLSPLEGEQNMLGATGNPLQGSCMALEMTPVFSPQIMSSSFVGLIHRIGDRGLFLEIFDCPRQEVWQTLDMELLFFTQ